MRHTLRSTGERAALPRTLGVQEKAASLLHSYKLFVPRRRSRQEQLRANLFPEEG